MNIIKRVKYDLSFWILLVVNIYCIVYYYDNPGEFISVIWVYWAQSVLIGVFNFFDLLTLPKPGRDNKQEYISGSRGCSASFFLIHYSFFHLVYLFFLPNPVYKIDLNFFCITIAAFSFNLLAQFIRHKQLQKGHRVSVGTIFFMPYLRIIPMHLMILGPAFFHVSPSIIFLILKTIADVSMYLVASPYKDLPEHKND